MDTAATSSGRPASREPKTRASTTSAPIAPISTSTIRPRSSPPPASSTLNPVSTTSDPSPEACSATLSRAGSAWAYGSGPGTTGG